MELCIYVWCVTLTNEKMGSNSPDRQQLEDSQNLFTRHPFATIAILLTIFVLVFIPALELFLKTFSGLGNPPLYELSPLYGYMLKPNQVIEPRGNIAFLYGARLTTNNLGLRAADDWDSKPAGKILFLGDSVTYGGQYIPDSGLFTSVAGAKLPGWQVGNGATNAWGIENMVGLIKDYHFAPAEVIVICVIEGDFYRGTTRAPSMPLWTEKPGFALQDLLMHLFWKINISRYGREIDQFSENPGHMDKVVDRAALRLKQLDDYLKQKQIRHFIFILPTRSQTAEGEPKDRRVELALEKYEINAEYLLPELIQFEPDRNKRLQWYHDEAHLELSGHQAYGKLIGDSLAKALPERLK